jgi:3-oxoacyl-(acyl-carrier-protein) synthase
MAPAEYFPATVNVHTARSNSRDEPVVITGLGVITSVGNDRESVWKAVREGRSGVRRLEGLEGIPDGLLIGAPVGIQPDRPGELKVITLARHAATEALEDAQIDWKSIDRDRFACAVSGHIGDTSMVLDVAAGRPGSSGNHVAWWRQWLPNTACWSIARQFGLYGPRLCHSTACASGLIDILGAVRAIQDGQCDIALAGSAEGFHPLFAAGFYKMKVLAHHDDPAQACRPFDRARNGFVMGEGGAMFVLERLSHALRRGASIYAILLGGKMLADAYHVTGLDADSDSLAYLITSTLKASGLVPRDIGYINAHGTGTQQNDVMETRGIRRAMGQAADKLCVSSTKSMLGHLVNAAGSVELAITTLALRDGYAPPTVNLTNPDPDCDLDCVPLVGRSVRFDCALKFSIAFGGHQVAVALRRWPEAKSAAHYGDAKAA